MTGSQPTIASDKIKIRNTPTSTFRCESLRTQSQSGVRDILRFFQASILPNELVARRSAINILHIRLAADFSCGICRSSRIQTDPISRSPRLHLTARIAAPPVALPCPTSHPQYIFACTTSSHGILHLALAPFTLLAACSIPLLTVQIDTSGDRLLREYCADH